MKIFKVIGIAGLLLTLAIPVYSADYTIRDKNYRINSYVKDGKIYDKNYKIEGYITKDGAIRDRDYRINSYVNRNNSGKNGHGSGRHK